MADEKDWKPSDEIFYRGYYHDDVFYDNINYEHIEAYMDVDGELRCVWRKHQGPPVPDVPPTEEYTVTNAIIPVNNSIANIIDGYKMYFYSKTSYSVGVMVNLNTNTVGDVVQFQANNDYIREHSYYSGMTLVPFINGYDTPVYHWLYSDVHDQVNYPWVYSGSFGRYMSTITWTQYEDEKYPGSGNEVGFGYSIDHNFTVCPAFSITGLTAKDCHMDTDTSKFDGNAILYGMLRGDYFESYVSGTSYNILKRVAVGSDRSFVFVNPLKYAGRCAAGNKYYGARSKGYIGGRSNPVRWSEPDYVRFNLTNRLLPDGSPNHTKAHIDEEIYTDISQIGNTIIAVKITFESEHYWHYGTNIGNTYDEIEQRMTLHNCRNYQLNYLNNNYIRREMYEYGEWYSDSTNVQRYSSLAKNCYVIVEEVNVVSGKIHTKKQILKQKLDISGYSYVPSGVCYCATINDVLMTRKYVLSIGDYSLYYIPHATAQYTESADFGPSSVTKSNYIIHNHKNDTMEQFKYDVEVRSMPSPSGGTIYTTEIVADPEAIALAQIFNTAVYIGYKDGVYKIVLNEDYDASYGRVSAVATIWATYDFKNFKKTRVANTVSGDKKYLTNLLPNCGSAIKGNELYCCFNSGGRPTLTHFKLW